MDVNQTRDKELRGQDEAKK